MTSPAYHHALEWESESVRLSASENFTDYYNKHLEVLQRMLVARFSSIQNESTTIKMYRRMHAWCRFLQATGTILYIDTTVQSSPTQSVNRSSGSL